MKRFFGRWAFTGRWALVTAAALLGGFPRVCHASYAFYVGKELTEDGSVLVGGTGEEVSSHHLEIVPRATHRRGTTVRVGVTAEARIPGEQTEIPQVPVTFRYLSMSYSDFAGFPPPLTNGGLNEYQVAVRDVWAPSREELVAMTPTPQTGPQYSDLARIVLQRAKTAREGVEIIGRLINRYGYSTYGGNTHLIADPEEAWVVWELAGGQRLWAAERLGADEIRILYPGYIEEFPLDFTRDPDFLGAPHLIDFAVEQGWYAPDDGTPFNVHEVYGKQGVPARRPQQKYLSPEDLERQLHSLAPVGVAEMIDAVRDPRISDDEAGYGEVAHLRAGLPRELGLLWVAPTSSVTAPFLPWWIGVQEVPPEFSQHRYLTKDAASTFLDPDYAAQEATLSAGRLFKRLLYHTSEHPDVFFDLVTETLRGFEAKLLERHVTAERTAQVLIEAGETDLARHHLTLFSHHAASEALSLGQGLVAGVEAITKARFGIRRPSGDSINSQGGETVNLLPDADPDRPPE